ncbi:hypothetical protein H7U37_09045 [Pseudoflavonifractor phocaeensis]|uniref:anti-sigma factor family protein n=1 Tax=Pseudoflavonifractor phocaeensis TaxID=1870988 RepID=UPI001959E3A4|nr:hypothetical protein [Pseudoflavonifractor phocaeensis]MBM6938668.1 hypothetical protein [Pseudoflavonifractor phocaeensis]
MSEHLTLEELSDFLADNQTGQAARLRAARINAHLFQCPSCYQLYERLCELQEAAQQAALSQSERLPARLARSAARFRLRLQSAARQLLLDSAQFGGCDFDYPLAVGARSAGGSGVQRDTLIDNENSYNQLSIRDGVLSLRLDAEDLPQTQPLAVLLDQDGALVDCQAMTLDGPVWTARLDASGDGSYELAIL